MIKNNLLKNEKIIKNLSLYFIIAIPLFVSLLMYSSGLSGNDFWWHVKVGEWICNNKALPNSDIFSWYGMEYNIEWYSQEWLSDVVFYLIYNSFGEKGIFVLCLLLEQGLLLAIIVHNYRQIRKRILFSALFLCLTAVCFSLFMYGRPQIFSGILLYILLYCLYKFYRTGKKKSLIIIPFVTVLWSNMHGGCANLSYIMCALFLFVAVKPFNSHRVVNFRKNKIYIKHMIIVTAVSVAAIFINPQGLYVFLYPYVNMGNSFMLSVIAEWGAPDAKNVGQLILYFLPVFIAVISMAIGKKKILFIDGILTVFYVYLFLRSIRFAFLLFIVLSVFVFRYFPLTKLKVSLTGSTFVVIALSCFMVCAIVKAAGVFYSEQIISRVLDASYCRLIKEDKVERVFNDYNYGETLIFENTNCFIDARVDLFADNIFEDSMNLLYLKDLSGGSKVIEAEKIIDKYKFDAIIIQSDRPLKVYLDSNSDEYDLIRSDKNASYYHVKRYYKY